MSDDTHIVLLTDFCTMLEMFEILDTPQAENQLSPPDWSVCFSPGGADSAASF